MTSLSLPLTLGNVGVLFAVPIGKVRVIVTFSTAFGPVLVQKTGHTLAVTLASGPIVACKRVLHGAFLALFRLVQVFDAHGCLTSHELVLAQDQVLVVPAVARLRDGVDCAAQVDASLRIVEVGQLTVLIYEN